MSIIMQSSDITYDFTPRLSDRRNKNKQVSNSYRYTLFMKIFSIIILLITTIAIVYKFQQKKDENNNVVSTSNSQDVQEIVTVSNLRSAVEELVEIDDEFQNAIFIYSEEKLNELKVVNPELISKAQVGDYLLLYSKSAYIYRLETNEIVAYATR